MKSKNRYHVSGRVGGCGAHVLDREQNNLSVCWCGNDQIEGENHKFRRDGLQRARHIARALNFPLRTKQDVSLNELQALQRVLIVTSREKYKDALDAQDRESIRNLRDRLQSEFEGQFGEGRKSATPKRS